MTSDCRSIRMHSQMHASMAVCFIDCRSKTWLYFTSHRHSIRLGTKTKTFIDIAKPLNIFLLFSLRRAIQVMRENKWNPDCLIRRSYNSQIDEEKYCVTDLTKDLHLWTAHRVMEWLRVVNLAEYAPNLRGAGVHGALMVYEDRFTDELLADLLSIPSTKSLIRRHLCTHFKDLLGREVIQDKRKAETTLGYQPLTLTSKIKVWNTIKKG